MPRIAGIYLHETSANIFALTAEKEALNSNQTTDQNSKNLALLSWLGALLFGFIPPLVFFLVKSDDAYVKQQAKEALNWCITALIGYVIAGVLTFIVIGALLFPVIGICHIVFCIMGAVGSSKGNDFKVPWMLRFIK